MYELIHIEYDDYCSHCKKGYFFEIGFENTCENCGMVFNASTEDILEF